MKFAPALLCSDTVVRVNETGLEGAQVLLGHRMEEVCHRCIRVVDSPEAAQERHYRHANYAHAAYKRLQREETCSRAHRVKVQKFKII